MDVLATADNKKVRIPVAGDWVYWAYQKVSVERLEVIEEW